jgi:mRNA-degrading endonuclease RelE of RelBE toxin-antitoxin system
VRRLRMPAEAAVLVQGLHPDIKRKVRGALDEILAEPEVGKSLQRELAGLRSYRIGRLRLIYRVTARGVIEVVALGPRSVIYEETLRLVRKRE